MQAPAFQGAKKQLLIYDAQVSDNAIQKVLQERAKAGVEIRIIGGLEKPLSRVKVRRLADLRLHVRAIVRDGNSAFVGSQSLRKLELEKRREVGVVVTDLKVVEGIMNVFARDWAETPSGRKLVKKTRKVLKQGKTLAPDQKLVMAAAV